MAVALIAAAGAAIGTARAQIAAPPMAIPMSAAPAMPEGVRIALGASANYAPLYEGSSRYELSVLPIFKFSLLGGGGAAGSGGGLLGMLSSFDARSLDDISVGILKHGNLEMGPLAGYRAGRQAKDTPRLRGLGDIDGGLVVGAYARYDLKPVYAPVSLHYGVTGDDTGYLIRLAAGTEVPVVRGVLVTAAAFLDLADNQYMDAYFGVDALQAARSGYTLFDAGAGLKSIGMTLGSEIALSESWTLHATAAYTRLLGDAAESPIVETADRYEARLGLSRAFELRWK